MIDLKLLRQAAVLARHRNFARAAEALNVTQPALSRSIAGLETAIGERLFNRTKQGVEPTAFGQLLLARGASLIDGARELERTIAMMRGLDIGELKLAAGLYPAELSMTEAIARLVTQHPKLRVELTTTDVRRLVADVLAGRTDVLVIDIGLTASEPQLSIEPLPEHPVVFYCRADHPLLGEPAAGLERILEFPFVGARLPARVASAVIEWTRLGTIDADTGDYLPPIKIDSVHLTKQIVASSDAVGAAPLALVAREAEAGQLATLAFRAPWMRTRYAISYRRDRLLSPAAEAFINELKTVEARIAADDDRFRRLFGLLPSATA